MYPRSSEKCDDLLNISLLRYKWQAEMIARILQIPHYSGAIQQAVGHRRRRRFRRGVIHFPSTLHRSNGPSNGGSKLLQGVPVALRRRSSTGARAAWRRFHEDFWPPSQSIGQRDIDVFRLHTTPRCHFDLSRDPKAREHTVHLDPSETAWHR